MAGKKSERAEEKALVSSTQMGYDVFSPPAQRKLNLQRAAKNYGKNSVLKMLAKKLKLTKKAKTKKIVAADYAFVKDEL